MNLDQLNSHLDLLQKRERTAEMLTSLRAHADPDAKQMPGVHDRVGDLDHEIADVEAAIKRINQQIAESESAISAFIDTLPDSKTRTVFRLRFLRGLLWKEISGVVGCPTRSITRMCYQTIKTKEKENK